MEDMLMKKIWRVEDLEKKQVGWLEGVVDLSRIGRQKKSLRKRDLGPFNDDCQGQGN